MKIVSLNIGMPKNEMFGEKEYFTGLCKKQVNHGLDLRIMGFQSDGVANSKFHGGEEKAVCAYNFDHYAHWEKVLGHPMPEAAFGENFTVSGLDETSIHIGDIFKIGDAQVQVSQPRQPCKTLVARFQRNDFTKLIVQSGYTGLYFRVVEEGVVAPGDELISLENGQGKVTVAFANHIYHHDRKNRDGIKRILAVKALSASWRKSLDELLEKTF